MTNIVPFGEKKGLPVEAILGDEGYHRWLYDSGAIEKIRQRHPEFYTVLVSKGQRPQETSRHNKLQALFTRRLYRQAFCRVAKPGWEDAIWNEFLAEVSYAVHCSPPEMGDALRQLPRTCSLYVESKPTFEIKGIDVEIRMTVGIHRPSYAIDLREYELPRSLQCPGENARFTVEIKPVVGVDYAATLRQMRALEAKYLFLESFCEERSGIKTVEFVKMFEGSDRDRIVVWKDDVDEEYKLLLEREKQSITIH